MKYLKKYILKPIIIIAILMLVFTFIAATPYIAEWSIWLRIAYIVSLIIAFAVTDT